MVQVESSERVFSGRAFNLRVDQIRLPNGSLAQWEVLEHTGGAGVDHVVEVGGAGTLAQSFNAVGFGGQVTLIGVLSGPEGNTSPHGLMFKSARLQGIFVGNRRMFEDMNRAIAINRLQPVVDRVFPFDEARRAFDMVAAGGHFGKIAIAL